MLMFLLFAAEPLVLDDGDRVVLVGNTLIEREQRYGWWEAALVSAFPGKKVQFRNLGWIEVLRKKGSPFRPRHYRTKWARSVVALKHDEADAGEE